MRNPLEMLISDDSEDSEIYNSSSSSRSEKLVTEKSYNEESTSKLHLRSVGEMDESSIIKGGSSSVNETFTD